MEGLCYNHRAILKKIILLNKKEGETPLEALEAFRGKHPRYKNEKMTYAGRLDPMASGLLLVLVGEKVREKEKYLGVDKEYEFEMLFGFSTDTHDILGKVTSFKYIDSLGEEAIQKNLKFFKGKIKQKVPIYSAKTWEDARKGKVAEGEEREVQIKSLKLLKIRRITSEKLLQNITKRLGRVRGDFRQKEILKLWQKNLNKKNQNFYIAKFKTSCTSGTYVRALANDLGLKMGVPALAYSIKRTKIGKWSKISS